MHAELNIDNRALIDKIISGQRLVNIEMGGCDLIPARVDKVISPGEMLVKEYPNGQDLV